MMKILICSLLLGSVSLAQLIDEDVLPFGAYSSKHGHEAFYDNAQLRMMHDTLGMNQIITAGFDSATVRKFYDKGIYPYDGGAISDHWPWDIKPTNMYGHATYFLCQPESTAYYTVSFNTLNGNVRDDSLWAIDYAATMLGDLELELSNKPEWVNPPAISKPHFLYLKMGIGNTDVDDTVPVGVFKAVRLVDSALRFEDTVRVGDVSQEHDSTIQLINEADSSDNFTVIDGITDAKRTFRFDFITLDTFDVFIDYLVITDNGGKDLFTRNGDAINLITSYADSSIFQDKVLGYFAIDTPHQRHYRSVAFVDSLVQEVTSDWDNPVRAVGWLQAPVWPGGAYGDFTRADKPGMLWTYLYPIWLNTSYTGYDPDPWTVFQTALDYFVAEPLDSIRRVMAELDYPRQILYGPQYWYCDPDDPEDPCIGDDLETHRKPTRSELRCLTYLGMCYHPTSIMVWKYDSSNQSKGIIKQNGEPREGIYEIIRDEINPYLKAIDEYYMPLTWLETGYASPTDHDPDVRIITNIKAIPIPPDTINPDAGWTQVGVYSDGYDYYFMLVNRACSKDEDGNEAGSVTAIAEFNREMFDNAARLVVIDLSHEVRLAGGDTGYVAIPETTRVALSRNKLKYSTILRAGEGRFYKIAQENGSR